MEKIIKRRQTGKTTRLINLAAERGGYIVCLDKREAGRVHREAMEAGKKIHFPITFNELIYGGFHMQGVKEFYIDQADHLLRQLARGVPVVAIAMDDETPGEDPRKNATPNFVRVR